MNILSTGVFVCTVRNIFKFLIFIKPLSYPHTLWMGTGMEETIPVRI